MTKQAFLKRLRAKLALSIDGLRVAAAETAPAGRPTRSRKS
jgi:hypothetical protein